MSDKELISRGAQCVTGDLVLKNKVVGFYRNGIFNVTPDGEAELAVVDVQAKEVSAPKAAKEPARKAPKAAKVEAAEPAEAPIETLDDILGAVE